MKKRGQFEIQFNWIFILVAGGLILLFASVFVLKQKGISDRTVDQSVSNSLKAIIAGAEASTDTLNFVELPKLEIEFECGKYRVGSASRSFQIMSVFAPSKIESNRLLTWTLDWNTPYRVTNFLYLTSPNVRYILVGEGALAGRVNKSMPGELNKNWVKSAISSVGNKNDAKARFVFINTNVDSSILSKFSKMEDKDVTALKVEGDVDEGRVEFFEKNGNVFESKGTSYYLRIPSLVGAVFTEDVEVYTCIMENAFRKLNIVTQIYEKKTRAMKDYYMAEADPSCVTDHRLDSIITIKEKSKKFDSGNILAIDSAADGLVQQNKDAQLHSCALIY